MKTSGDTKTGILFKTDVENMLKEYGFIFIPNNLIFSDNRQMFFSKNVHVGSSIYGDKFKINFVINAPQLKEPICIECRYQQVGGTVDQKFPYLVNNLKRTYFPSILVLDGGGYKSEAKNWIISQKDDNFQNVFSLGEFKEWLENVFVGEP